MIRNKEALHMYLVMRHAFNTHDLEELYDVDMFVSDVAHELFIETDPQDIDEDDYLIFQEALILLVRDDQLADHYGTEGLVILHAELMDAGEHYYVNKEARYVNRNT